jgi:hyperosmotically inducible protein
LQPVSGKEYLPMTALRYAFAVALAVALVATAGAATAAERSVGQVIDDTVVTAEIKGKLAAEKLSSLTRIEVKTTNGIVTLNGTVDDPGIRARAAQIASTVNGVRGVVNNVHVAGTTIPPAPVATVPSPASVPSATASVDATGVVASIDGANGTITLQDGRVLRVTNQTMVWQPATMQHLRPGAQVMVRDALPVGVQPSATVAPEWRMGTVRSVDHGSGVLVLSDNTVVRVRPSAVVRRGNERVGLDYITPGSEVVIRAAPVSAEGSALPGRVAAAPTVEASEVNVVWVPVSSR